MGYSSVAIDPAAAGANSDAASSALYAAEAASSVAAALKLNLTDLVAAPASDHTANGPQCNDIAAGESVTIMDCVYMGTDGEWHKTDADAIASGGGLLAISLESKGDGEAMNVALPGSFVRDDTWNWSLTTEQGRVYLDTETAGGLTQTPPSGTDDVVRIAGYARTTHIIYFSPEIVVVHN
jgi:hypothetical protein